MRAIAILSSLLLAALPAVAPAQDAAPVPTLTLTPGETVSVRIAENPAGFVVLSRARGAAQGTRAADTVRFTFSADGGSTMLHAENGYARGFNYRARMHLGSRSANTSVCTVMPRIGGFESWPHPIDRIELSAPGFSEGGGMRCE